MKNIKKILKFFLTILTLSNCFSEKKSIELAEIDENSRYPNLSLTYWGDPVLLVVDKNFKEAQKEESSKNYSKALDLFNETINLVIKNESSLFVDQYLNILVHIAYCHSDLDEFDKAIEVYEIRKAILTSDENWFSKLPSGLKVLVKKEYGQIELLAQNYQEMGVAYYRSKDFNKGKIYLTLSSKIYSDLELNESVIKNLNYLGLLAKEFKNWDDLLFAGEEIQKSKEVKQDIELKIHSLKFIFLANLNKDQKEKAKKTLKEIIQIEKKIDHPDLENDLELLKSI